MTKSVKVSDDSGTTYYTLPGSQGEFSDELGALDDTIFGQNFKSSQPNLNTWSITADAVYKGFAGYLVDIYTISGSATSMTGEAMSLVSGETYKVTASTKNLWDVTASWTIYDNGTDKTSEIENIDYLHGRVTFKSTYTVTGPVTVTGKYYTKALTASYKSFKLTTSCDTKDTTTVANAQSTSGHRAFDYGLKTVELELSGLYNSSNTYRTDLIGRNLVMLEINPDGNSKSVARGFFKATSRKQSGNVGALEEETVTYALFVPQDALEKLKSPFSWLFTSTDLSTAVVKCIEAWQNETTLLTQYSEDGTTGLRGTTIVTDISLSGGLDSMNTFSVQFQGTGAVTAY